MQMNQQLKVKVIEAERGGMVVSGSRWVWMPSSYSVVVKLQLCKLSKFYRSAACQHAYGQQRCGTEMLKTLTFVLNAIITNTGSQNVNPNLHQQFCLWVHTENPGKKDTKSLFVNVFMDICFEAFQGFPNLTQE